MKPVKQTILTPERGDCFSACLASILEVPLFRIPNFHDLMAKQGSRHFTSTVQTWLRGRGYDLTGMYWDEVKSMFPKVYHIMSGKSPRLNCYHAVVGFGGEMVHDPHPDGTGILEEPFTDKEGNDWNGKIIYEFLIPVNPALTGIITEEGEIDSAIRGTIEPDCRDFSTSRAPNWAADCEGMGHHKCKEECAYYDKKTIHKL